MLPSTADLYATGIEDRQALAELKSSWEGVAGFDLTPAMTAVVTTPRCATPSRVSQLATTSSRVAWLDLASMSRRAALQGLPAAPFQLVCERDERLFGVLLHFDLGFVAPASPATLAGENSGSGGGPSSDSALQGGSGGVEYSSSTTTSDSRLVAEFTTSPRAPTTHFQQLVLNFPRSIKVAKGDVLDCRLACVPCGRQGRDVRFELEVSLAGVTASVEHVMAHVVPTSSVQGPTPGL